jgi:two-component system sensor histidine kinase KdpD
MDDVLEAAVKQIGGVFDAEAAILLAPGSLLNRQPHPASTMPITDKEYSVAVWAFENGRAAGRFTDTLPLATAQFLPLHAPERTVGVIGLRTRGERHLTFDESLLLETFASQIALTIERELLDEAAEHNAMLRESERLYTTLLNSISHELRTPIATIAGAAGGLLDAPTNGNAAARAQLVRDIQDAADRLNRLVANLLDMSRLESGRLQLKLEWCDVGDVIGVAVKRLERHLAGRAVSIEQAPDVPLVRLDFVLMEQVLVNLLENAAAYTPPGAPIEIAAARRGDTVVITIADHGPGISKTDVDHIFDKFYRGPRAATGGTGLGLSIGRGLVEAHGGTLTAGNAPGGGARFTVRLPAGAAPPPVREAEL